MPQYEATLSDGRTVTLEADSPPSEADVLSAVASYESSRGKRKAELAEQTKAAQLEAAQNRLVTGAIDLAERAAYTIGGTLSRADVTGVSANALARQGIQPPPLVDPETLREDAATIERLTREGLRLPITAPLEGKAGEVAEGAKQFAAETASSFADVGVIGPVGAIRLAPSVASKTTPQVMRLFQAQMTGGIPSATESAFQAETLPEQVKGGLGVVATTGLPLLIGRGLREPSVPLPPEPRPPIIPPPIIPEAPPIIPPPVMPEPARISKPKNLSVKEAQDVLTQASAQKEAKAGEERTVAPTPAKAVEKPAVPPDYAYDSPESKAWWEESDRLQLAYDATQPFTPERAAARSAKKAHDDLAFGEHGNKRLAARRLDRNNPLKEVGDVVESVHSVMNMTPTDLTGWRFEGDWQVFEENGRQFRKVIGPNGQKLIVWKDVLHPLQEAALEKATTETIEKGAEYARSQQNAAEVYGPMRPQPGEGAREMPAAVSGERVQPQAEGRLPGTAEGPVLLTPEKPAKPTAQVAARSAEEIQKPAETKTAETVAKEPWQMTQSDFVESEARSMESRRQSALREVINEIEDKIETGPRAVGVSKVLWLLTRSNRNPLQKQLMAQYEVAKKNSELDPRVDNPIKQQIHRRIVESAIEQGKPVPPKVLADYPDLVKPPEPLKPVTEKGPSEKAQRQEGVQVAPEAPAAVSPAAGRPPAELNKDPSGNPVESSSPEIGRQYYRQDPQSKQWFRIRYDGISGRMDQHQITEWTWLEGPQKGNKSTQYGMGGFYIAKKQIAEPYAPSSEGVISDRFKTNVELQQTRSQARIAQGAIRQRLNEKARLLAERLKQIDAYSTKVETARSTAEPTAAVPKAAKVGPFDSELAPERPQPLGENAKALMDSAQTAIDEAERIATPLWEDFQKAERELSSAKRTYNDEKIAKAERKVAKKKAAWEAADQITNEKKRTLWDLEERAGWDTAEPFNKWVWRMSEAWSKMPKGLERDAFEQKILSAIDKEWIQATAALMPDPSKAGAAVSRIGTLNRAVLARPLEKSNQISNLARTSSRLYAQELARAAAEDEVAEMKLGPYDRPSFKDTDSVEEIQRKLEGAREKAKAKAKADREQKVKEEKQAEAEAAEEQANIKKWSEAGTLQWSSWGTADGGTRWKPVSGKPVQLESAPNHKFFIWKNGEQWIVVEVDSGRSVGKGGTRKAAIQEANDSISSFNKKMAASGKTFSDAVAAGAKDMPPKPGLSVAQPVGTGGAKKEPWQMTRDQAIDQYLRDIFGKTLSEMPQKHRSQYYTTWGDAHLAAVKKALAEGMPVPPEVMADYPRLTTPKITGMGGAEPIPQGPGAGTAGALPGAPMPVAASPTAPVIPVKALSQIIRDLSSGLSTPIRFGRLTTTKLGGYFKKVQNLIGAKRANDMPIVSHEVGHKLSTVLDLTSDPVIRTELHALGDPALPGSRSSWTKNKSAKYRVEEGVAEYVRRWLEDPADAATRAPNMHRFFESALNANPDLGAVMRQAQADVRLWRNAPAEARLGSSISTESPNKVRYTLDNLMRDVVDDLHFLRLAVDDAARSGPILPSQNPYTLARNLRGVFGMADRFIRRGIVDFKTKEVIRGTSLEDALKPVAGRIDEFRRWIVAKRAKELQAQGRETGLVPSDVDFVANKYDADPAFQEAFTKIKAWNDALLKYAVDSGLISQESATLMRGMNQDYVPFHRIFEVGAGEMPSQSATGTGVGLNVGKPGSLRRLRGSTRDIIDPLETMVKNAYTLITASEKNAINTSLADLSSRQNMGRWVERVATPKEVVRVQLERIREQLEAAGADLTAVPDDIALMFFKPSKQAPFGENIIKINRGGKLEFYRLDRELFDTFHALDQESSGRLITLLSAPAQLLRSGVTLAPDFAIANMLRDTVSASVISRYTAAPFITTLRGLAALAGKKSIVDEWAASGGRQSIEATFFDRAKLQKFLTEKITKDLTPTERATVYLKSPLTALRLLTGTFEEATRIGEFKAVYDKLVKEGMSPGDARRQAAFEARDLQDFAKGGAQTKIIRRLAAFWNAALQANVRLANAFRNRPLPTIAKGLAFVTIPKILEQALNWNDDDYWDRPQWERDFFFLVPYGKDDLGHTKFIRIPTPFEIGIIFGTIPGRMMQFAKERNDEAFNGLFSTVLKQTVPNPVPQAVLTMIEAAAGRQGYSFWRGRPIVPESLKEDAPELQFTEQTSLTARKVGKTLGLSPAKIDYVIQGMAGGIGRQLIQQGADRAISLITGEPRTAKSQFPGGRFFTTPAGIQSEAVDRFYRALNEARAEVSREKAGLKTTGQQANIKTLERTAREIANLRKRMLESTDDKERQELRLRIVEKAKLALL